MDNMDYQFDGLTRVYFIKKILLISSFNFELIENSTL